MRNNLSVTAVVLNYNSYEDTEKCIRFLKKQSYQNFEIVIVDNKSTKRDEVKRLQSLCIDNNIIFYESDKNGGFSYGNNIGIKAAQKSGADWVWIINPDVVVDDIYYLDGIMCFAQKDIGIGLIGTRSILPSGENQNPLREITAWEEILFPLTILLGKIKGKKYFKTEEKTGYCQKLVGCCFFIKMELLIKSNYLDDSVFLYSEEPIIAKTAQKFGYKILYINELEVFHNHIDNVKNGNKRDRLRQSLISRRYYINQYSDYVPGIKQLALLSNTIQSILWRLL